MCKPGGGLIKLGANQGVGRGWIGGGSGKSLILVSVIFDITFEITLILLKSYLEWYCLFQI